MKCYCIGILHSEFLFLDIRYVQFLDECWIGISVTGMGILKMLTIVHCLSSVMP